MATYDRVLVGVCTLALTTIVLTSCASTDDADDAPSQEPSADSAPYYDALPDSIKEAGALVIGSDLAYPPFEYVDEAGDVAGFEPALFAPLEDLLGVELVWEHGAFDTLFPGIEAGRYDVEIGATNDRAERDEIYDVIDYMKNGTALLVAAGNPLGIESVEDMCGIDAAGAAGTSQLDLLEAQSQACVDSGEEAINIIIPGTDPAAMYAAVYSGQADAAADNYLSVVSAANAQSDKAEVAPFQFGMSYLGIFLTKDNELTPVLFDAMTELMADPAYLETLSSIEMLDGSTADGSDLALDAPIMWGARDEPLE